MCYDVRGFPQELDQLMVSRMVESVSTATTALISLVELLDKVKNMVISDVIRKEVESALSHLHQVRERGTHTPT